MAAKRVSFVLALEEQGGEVWPMFLVNMTESDIPRVNQPSLDRMKELEAQWATLKARGLEILDRDIPAFNKRLWDAGLGAIWKF